MVQIFEWLAIGTFVLGFLLSTIEMLYDPKAYKAKEVSFFTDHKYVTKFDKFLFILATLSVIFLATHILYERFNLSQIFGYLMIILYGALFPFFFYSKRFSRFMLNHVQHSHHHYLDVIARLILLALMIGTPLLIR